jgi:glycosyltransferase involved in cell wall biosynthesis
MLFSRYLSKRKVPCVFYIPGDVHLKRFFKIDKSIYYLSISNTRKELIENRDGVKIDGVVTPGIPQVYLEPSSENSKNQNNLLFVGRLDNQKGLDDLIVIFEKTKISYPGLKLTLVGDGPERKRIEGLIAEKGLSEDINITGQIPQTEIQRYYQNAALLLHPADRESFCIVVLEAMAFGLPVIATDLPEIREASEGEAILLSKSDLNLWAKEIRFLLENPKLRERLSVKGREVARRHTWGVKSLEFEKSLKEAVEKHNEGVRRIAG